MKKFLFIIFAIGLYSNMLNANSVVPKGLMWQKHEIAQRVEAKIDRALRTYIKESDYFIDVMVGLKEPEKPDFNIKSNEKGKIRLSDEKPEKLPQDYVLFSKLGLEAPLISDFEESATLDGEKKALPYFEQLWEYNQAIDAYSVLKTLDIYIQISETVGEKIRVDIKKTLDNLHVDVNGVKPNFTITYTMLGASYNTNELPVKLSEKLELISRYSVMFGLLMAVLLAGLMGYFLLKKYLDYQKQMKNEEKEAEAAAAGAGAGAGGGAGDDKKKDDKNDDQGDLSNEEIKKLSGLQRFKRYLDHSPKESSYLVKKWIKEMSELGVLALNTLVQGLENEDLLKLFTYLSLEERNEWKSCVDRTISGESFFKADAFISEEIVQDILSVQFIADEEICDILLNLRTEDAARFVQENETMGGILLNALNTSFISNILNLLPLDKAKIAINNSMNVPTSLKPDEIDAFKKVIKNYQSVETKSPFVQKILELFPISTSDVEAELFRTLAQYNYDKESFLKLTYDYLPSELVHKLPESFLKPILQNYPMSKKAQLVFVLDEERSKIIKNIFAPEGSKANDMLSFETENIMASETNQAEIREKKDKIWAEFLTTIRTFIKNNPESKASIALICQEWLESIYTPRVEAHKPDLKLAS